MKNKVFWNLTPYRLADFYRYFGGNVLAPSPFCLEVGGSIFLQNVDKHLQVATSWKTVFS
jgi:hypothetical protein